MALTVTATITQSIPVNGNVTITFTDTTTGISGLVSRTLVIKDDNGNTLDTISMGSNPVATYTLTADTYLSFTESIIDNSGLSVGNFTYLSDSFYQYNFSMAVAGISSQCCDTFGILNNLYQAEVNRNAAIYMATFGQGVNAQALITNANFLVSTPYYA